MNERARAALRRLEWHMRGRRVTSTLTGEHRSIFRGRGMEFDQVVRYGFGDDIRDVDWNVTARLGDVYRKVFVEDREVTLFVVVADDPALQFGSGAAGKRDVLLDLAALTMLVGAVNRERVALLHQTPAGERLHPPSRRRDRILAAIASLYAAPAPDPAGAHVDFSPVLRTPIPTGALIVRLGEVPLRPPPIEWAGMRRHHPVVGVRVEDRWEREGPALGEAIAYDPVACTLARLRDTPADRERHAAWRAERERLWHGWWPDVADRVVVDADADPLAALTNFLRARGRSAAVRQR